MQCLCYSNEVFFDIVLADCNVMINKALLSFEKKTQTKLSVLVFHLPAAGLSRQKAPLGANESRLISAIPYSSLHNRAVSPSRGASAPKLHGLLLRRRRGASRHLRHPVGREVPPYPRRGRRRQLRRRRPPRGHRSRRQHAQPHPLCKRHFLEHLTCSDRIPRKRHNSSCLLVLLLFHAGASGDWEDNKHPSAGPRASRAQLPRGRARAQRLRRQVSATVT
jgi:hypothetical protein